MRTQELDEEHFIPDDAKKSNLAIWLCMLVLLLIAMAVWGFETWTRKQMHDSLSGKPFHAVTNRDISLFLWQHPSLMRAHQTRKAAYLPGFEYHQRLGIKEGQAEQIVVVAPAVLFHYHQWQRILGSWVSWRPVNAQELREFIDANPEWSPQFWKKAPPKFKELLQRINPLSKAERLEIRDIQLPDAVQQALVGWKNYFFEGDAINAAQFTLEEVRAFVHRYPAFARHHWRNLLEGEQADYLIDLRNPELSGQLVVAPEHIAAFLRVSLYNERLARGGR